MCANKYVDFVSDQHFRDCVKWVCEVYPRSSETYDKKWLQRNGIDPFKMVLDMINGDLDLKSLLSNETRRQYDKTSGGRIGDFHQKLLGGVKGWTDLGVGDETKVDLKKNDYTIFIELKNKYNTVNSDSLASVRRKLEKLTREYKGSTAYWAYIVAKNGTSGESEWNYSGENNPRIRKIWGSKVYDLITGQPKSLEKTWNALPSAILHVLKKNSKISREDMKELRQWFRDAFFKN